MKLQLSKPGHMVQLFLAVIIMTFGTSLSWAVECSIENANLTSQAESSLEADGEFIVEFTTCNEGTVTYDIPSVNLTGVVPIDRIALDNVPMWYLLENGQH